MSAPISSSSEPQYVPARTAAPGVTQKARTARPPLPPPRPLPRHIVKALGEMGVTLPSLS